jgi:glycerate dehydrogenase
LDAATIAALPELKAIGVLATGYNIVDIAAARARGIPVMNIPTYGTTSVAQHAFALLLELTQHTGHHGQTVRDGRWSQSLDFCYWDTPLVELHGLILGIVGAGRIGQAVGRVGAAFGMNVMTTDQPEGRAGLEKLLREADVVSLHCPLSRETHHLINQETLASRGPLIDDMALAEALNAGKLAGAGLDVLSVEPPPPDHPLYTARNCIITPHIAWATSGARQRLLGIAVDNVRSFLAGSLQNVVN